jgi:hypothetical protein
MPATCTLRRMPGYAGVGVGSPRELLPEAPTDPDMRISRIRLFGSRLCCVTEEVRIFRHAPACAVSLSARVSLIRLWSAVSPPSFPRTFPCAGALFPPRGPSGRFPRFLGTTKHSDVLPPLPRRFVSFASRYRRCTLGFAPAGARHHVRGPGVIHRIPHNRFLRRRRQDLPGSWRTSL